MTVYKLEWEGVHEGGILGLFSTREKAETTRKILIQLGRFSSLDIYVEEEVLDSFDPFQFAKGNL